MRIAVALAALVAIAVAGTAFAMWSQVLRVNSYVNTGVVDLAFDGGTVIVLDACGLAPGYGISKGNDWNASYLPNPGAKQLDKDVGCTSVKLLDTDGDGDYDTMVVTLHNVYPWYYTHIAFKVTNDGTIPVKIWRVVIDGKYYYKLNEQQLRQGVEIDLNHDGKPDVLIWWGDNFGAQLHPGQSADISFDITVLQGAPQGATLTLTISLQAVQWNEYSPGPIGG